MRTITALLLSILLVSNCIAYSQETNVVPGNLIVMINQDANAETLVKELEYINGTKTNLKIGRELSGSMHIYLFEFDETTISRNIMLSAVRKNRVVKIAQFNHTFEERNIPNDAQFGSLWNMHNTGQNGGTPSADIHATEAWNITTGGLTAAGDTIVVAVIDGGFDLNQQDLNYWKNWNEIPNNSVDDDNNGYTDDYDGWNGASGTDNFTVASHGTHVAGIVGARGNNNIGVTGVNWNVKIMAVSYGFSGGSFESNVVASYAYVMDQRRIYNQTNGAQGAFVVATNSSFGVNNGQPNAYPLWCAMYDSLGSVGILSAGATANANFNVDIQGDIPTACESHWLVTVTNTTKTDGKNSSCGFGSTTIDLGAPGTGIISTIPSNSYSSMDGTSMATPHVAGAIALMYSVPCANFIAEYKADPAGVALKVKDSLMSSVDPIASMDGITVTGGRLNVFKAVTSIHYYCSGVSVADYSEEEAVNILQVYPNPANGFATVKFLAIEPENTIRITNTLGQQVKHFELENCSKGKQDVEINLNDFEKGIYFISLNSGHSGRNTVKLLVY